MTDTDIYCHICDRLADRKVNDELTVVYSCPEHGWLVRTYPAVGIK
jgi:hypothetical protein